jgi:alcohol dehydrogenase class IV
LKAHEQRGRRWELAQLLAADLGRVWLYASPSVRARVAAELDFPTLDSLEALPATAETLVVAGGGTQIDRAKRFRQAARPGLRLIAIPTIWGSGAEVSPIAVLSSNAGKEIHVGEDLIPDHYVAWPELARTVSAARLRHACGDVWAHALEAFTSPLASDTIRRDATELMSDVAGWALGYDQRWFEASAAACLLQARSSVGLVHGFAHVLEAPLAAAQPEAGWGHARLCSTFLLPVLAFNRSRSPKVETIAAEHSLDLSRVELIAHTLFDSADYDAATALAADRWGIIARDRCSRTNCNVVRHDSLNFFLHFRGSPVIA